MSQPITPPPPSERTESAYYSFRDFDLENARNVLSYYVPFFPSAPVLELACGPGVFLGLLGEAGIKATGVDLDAGMVDIARTAGHDVILDDAIHHLKSVPDNSVAGLFAAHFLEHLPAETVQTVYDHAARVLKPGGRFVAVVPNAACMSILAYDFWRDPTHVRFYDPMALDFFARQSGLSIERSGGNPNNHPGPPPPLLAPEISGDSSLSAAILEVVQHAAWLAEQAVAEPPSSAARRGQNSEATHSPAPVATADSLPSNARLWSELGHILMVMDTRVRTLQHEIYSVRTAYQKLLDQLYQENEVFVVAVKAEETE